MPIITALTRLRQKNGRFRTILIYTMRPCIKNKPKNMAGVMAQQLRAFVLQRTLVQVPAPHAGSQLFLTSVPEDVTSSSGS